MTLIVIKNQKFGSIKMKQRKSELRSNQYHIKPYKHRNKDDQIRELAH